MDLAGVEVAPNLSCVSPTSLVRSLGTTTNPAAHSFSTTFRHPNPEDGIEPGYAEDWDPSNPSRDVYAR